MLSARPTTQGLVAVKSSGSVAAVVELNCETDFVSRGNKFKDLLAKLTRSVLDCAKKSTPENMSDKMLVLSCASDALDYYMKSLNSDWTLSVSNRGVK
ncbi:hypothetical protein DICVIV_04752 [Dictyocaulus viviparus]|uniref:Translation elongation factor EFTs/EF1B dimerisation domain-containing protein n=1 Tax=Dictyocaulus viviparus TaxID=29172 RepID=A0A0D8XZ35_DICVI|nr:hypothetical protein DICVIV_04752 [Dictyocaulus viviparus]